MSRPTKQSEAHDLVLSVCRTYPDCITVQYNVDQISRSEASRQSYKLNPAPESSTKVLAYLISIAATGQVDQAVLTRSTCRRAKSCSSSTAANTFCPEHTLG